jgi:uncharacterized protein YjbI with pentapeptide repeats
MSFWWWMLAAVAAVVIGASVAIILLLTIASGAKPGTDRANARLDAVRTGLAVGAGIGAATGLILAFRRQHHQEIATDLTDRDATERRITELYTKAVEQLGSDKAAVRLGGLYALERLAQDNPAHRQTIVNVICAYLRMPFSPTAPADKPELEAPEEPGEPDPETETRTDAIGDTWSQERDTWQQERQVRLTAQRILGEHLRDDRAKDQHPANPPSRRLWANIHLDLSGATLIDLDLRSCVMAAVDFSQATFSGLTVFGSATFDGSAMFGSATFDVASFDSATFRGLAVFARSTFRDAPGFYDATFGSDATFDLVTFRGGAAFQGATFNGRAMFARANFTHAAGFEGTTFSGRATFSQATFNDVAGFTNATFGSDARFDRATFNNAAMFGGATFKGGEGSLYLERSRVFWSGAQHVWPTEWHLRPDGSGGYTVVRANDDGAPVARQLKDEQIGGDNDGGPGGLALV